MATFITLTNAHGHVGSKIAINVKAIIIMEAQSQLNEYKNLESGLRYFTKVIYDGGDKKYGITVNESIEQIQAEILLQKRLKKMSK